MNRLASVSRPASGKPLLATGSLTPAYSSDAASDGPDNRMLLMGAPMDVVTEAQAVKAIVDAAVEGCGHWTITANLDHVRRYHSDPAQKELIDSADLVVADGMPLVWASRLAREPLPERVSGSSMVWSVCEAAAERGQSIFLLGGNPGIAERAARVFEDRYAGLEIAGTACPPVGFENDAEELQSIETQLTSRMPDIVFVALGFPKQDLLIRRLREVLPGASFLGVGISLSYATGDLSRPPGWICQLGLEWAYRLWQEPTRRLLRRYLIDGLPFSLRLTGSAIKRRVRRRGEDEASKGWKP
jgi:N-acetylglucosaminyldiphosphoundecaprenol N-acetyl-beta-D-mannosaminyltransferase